jgi:hypothetical protein
MGLMSATRLPEDDDDVIRMHVEQAMAEEHERVSKLTNAELEAELRAMGIDPEESADRAAALFKDILP